MGMSAISRRLARIRAVSAATLSRRDRRCVGGMAEPRCTPQPTSQPSADDALSCRRRCDRWRSHGDRRTRWIGPRYIDNRDRCGNCRCLSCRRCHRSRGPVADFDRRVRIALGGNTRRTAKWRGWLPLGPPLPAPRHHHRQPAPIVHAALLVVADRRPLCRQGSGDSPHSTGNELQYLGHDIVAVSGRPSTARKCRVPSMSNEAGKWSGQPAADVRRAIADLQPDEVALLARAVKDPKAHSMSWDRRKRFWFDGTAGIRISNEEGQGCAAFGLSSRSTWLAPTW
jgi:hypothetical protein